MKLVKLIEQWHEDRNLIDGSTDKDQVLKLAQELGELSDSVCKEKDMRDDSRVWWRTKILQLA